MGVEGVAPIAVLQGLQAVAVQQTHAPLLESFDGVVVIAEEIVERVFDVIRGVALNKPCTRASKS